MTSTINRVLFFIILGISFAIFFIATRHFYSGTPLKQGSVVTIASIIFSLFFAGYIQLTGLLKEGYNHGPRLCRGGPYMWQGDSPRAKYCRELASTPEGDAQINRYECGKGMVGMPGKGFKFRTISDGRCGKQSDDKHDIENNGIF
jgi:hypothetical protein